MYDIVFSSNQGEEMKSMTMGSAKTKDEAESKLTESFVRFCRDVAHRPLNRTHYANGFAWEWKGITYQLAFQEVADESKLN